MGFRCARIRVLAILCLWHHIWRVILIAPALSIRHRSGVGKRRLIGAEESRNFSLPFSVIVLLGHEMPETVGFLRVNLIIWIARLLGKERRFSYFR